MQLLSYPARVCLTALCLAALAPSARAWEIINFDEVPLAGDSAWRATALDQSSYVSHGVEFNRTWNSEFNCCPGGWAVSNQRDQVTPGPDSSYSAFVTSSVGGGRNSSQFAVANNLSRGEARIGFPQPSRVEGMYITNVTYTYRAAVDGNDGAGFVKGPFVAGDWLKLDAVGLNLQGIETGRSTIYLADYRDGQSHALREWTWFDLTPLGDVWSLEFEMNSTDTGPFGMNTPAYFAVDDLTFHAVPEPRSVASALLGITICLGARRHTRSSRRGVWRGCERTRPTVCRQKTIVVERCAASRRLALTRT